MAEEQAGEGEFKGSGDFVARMADVAAALDRIEVGQTSIGTRLSSVEAGQKSLRADFLDELGKTRADIMERMVLLQHRLDGLNDHLTMGLGNSDRVEQKSDGVAEQNRLLAEQMTTMHKLLRRLEGRINDLEDRK